MTENRIPPQFNPSGDTSGNSAVEPTIQAPESIPNMVAYALDYAQRGWYVLPLHTPNSEHCDCGKLTCASPGKHPRTKNGLSDATRDPQQIRAWWCRWPNANIGVTTGPQSGIFVLDVDGGVGVESLRVLCEQHGRLPDTWVVETGREHGQHIYFRYPADGGIFNRTDQHAICPKLECKGAKEHSNGDSGGYVVAPPSLHISGRRYSLVESSIPPVEAPQWLLDVIRKPNPAKPTSSAQGNASTVVRGNRTNTLVSHAGTMHRRGMSSAVIEAALLKENEGFAEPLPEDKVCKIAHDIPTRYPHQRPDGATTKREPNAKEPLPDPSPPIDMDIEAAQVTTRDLLAEIYKTIREYLVMTHAQVVFLSVWVLHCWVFETSFFTAYLHIFSAVPECGKSRLLDVLTLFVPRPWVVSLVSVAVLRRKVAIERCTLLLDESDGIFSGPAESVAQIKTLLNDGFRASGSSYLCEKRAGGIEPVEFSNFCPKAIAGLVHLPATLQTRSVPIKMRRRLKSENVAKFRLKRAEAATATVRETLEQWSRFLCVRALGAVEPEMPEGLRDRQEDVCEHLLAIADFAGEAWPGDLRAALPELFSAVQSEESDGVLLLTDIRAIFYPQGWSESTGNALCDELTSAEMCERLNALPESPWKDCRHGLGIDQRLLAHKLRDFSVRPELFRFVKSGQPGRGYKREWFFDAWGRYLPENKDDVS